MAILLQPKYPIPDRTAHDVRRSKGEDGALDIGWSEGVLSDGRAFRAEAWAIDQVSMLTIFFSVRGLEDLDRHGLQRLVVAEGLAGFRDAETTYCDARKYVDGGGNEVWSVNIVVGADDETYLTDSVGIFPYSQVGDPNTMFNSTPIKAAHRPPRP